MANLSRANLSRGKSRESSEAKIDQVLEKISVIEKDISSLKNGQQSLEKGQNTLAQDVVSLKQGQQKLEDGQTKHYDLIQKQGILLEQVASDVKAVAEGHAVIRSEMQRGFEEVKEQIKFVDDKVTFVADKVNKIDQKLDEHIRLPAHV
ncbi:MAG: hypothetical protein FD145_245 [Candidatus Saganbacteria bacterium]|uniref:Uncharacterized protein n=1 Tax=Candidatus Saganbacteria bacterium TaxID=2575572 RepID=A0A833NZ43_UNCSA|nr:MAG: hypothetical protein FD145_245 [Candidatus Saganbacteria bacterium]